MATTQVSLIWEDQEGKRLPAQIYFDTDDVGTVALAQVQLTKYAILLGAVSGCAVKEASVTFPLAIEPAQSPTSGYSVRAGAFLSFVDTDTIGQGVYIPGILGSIMSDDVVNDADTDMAVLLAAMGGSGIDGEEPFSSRGSAAMFQVYRGGKGASRKVK